MGVLIALIIAAGFAVPIAVIGGGLAQGRTAAAALEAIARQPEAAGKIQTAMIIGLALIESLVIYAFVIALIFLFMGVPGAESLMKLVGK
ncbi:MAG: ATP synthase F0 subunit C [Armatimonadetes bacterium]|jgi:F-type H+-transporting ATPase subunit c|nr:ATP synthase F0 subunit C [Armatimonadota bacterium]